MQCNTKAMSWRGETAVQDADCDEEVAQQQRRFRRSRNKSERMPNLKAHAQKPRGRKR
jgi:hypothetical protein